MVYASGSIGLSPETKAIVPGGVAAEARQVLENMKNIVEAAGSDLTKVNMYAFLIYYYSTLNFKFTCFYDKVVKCTVLLTDMASFAVVNGVYAEYFPVDPPARMTYAVAALPLGALVEIDCIATL